MQRRRLLRSLLALWPLSVLARGRLAAAAQAPVWTEAQPFRTLQQRLGSRLLAIRSPLDACAGSGGADAPALFAKLKNPYYLGDEPGLTQTLGWAGAWVSRASRFAVRAESADDVAAAVTFARTQRVRLVVKGGGHSYFGNSNAADSLLVWTRALDRVEMHDAFVPSAAPPGTPARAAVSVGAGAIWGRVYDTVSVTHGRYVQGGGCLTVGVSGFVQGGGFGSFSKAFGTGAANLLEAEVVTADGRTRVVNRWHDPDLFFALRGGGGGTFGVVTRLTLATHRLPEMVGAVLFTVTANTDAAWTALVARVIAFYAEALFNSTWGEQLRFDRGRRLSVSMVCHGLDRDAIEAAWKPFLSWISAHGSDYRLNGEPLILAIPGRRFWDPAALRQVPGVVLGDDRPGAPPGNVFWATNLGEAGQLLRAYESMWLPARLLDPSQQARLVEALVAGRRELGCHVALQQGHGRRDAGGDCRLSRDGHQSAGARRVRAGHLRGRRSACVAGHSRPRAESRRGEGGGLARAAGDGAAASAGPGRRHLHVGSELSRYRLAGRVLGRASCATRGHQAQLRSRPRLSRAPRRRWDLKRTRQPLPSGCRRTFIRVPHINLAAAYVRLSQFDKAAAVLRAARAQGLDAPGSTSWI